MSRARALFFLDLVIVLLFGVAAFVMYTGGYFGDPLGVRISIRRADRPALVAILLGVIRWRMSRGHGFLGVPVARYRAWWARVFDPHADDLPSGPVRRWWHPWAAAAGLMAAVAVLMPAQWRHMDSVPDFGDPLFSAWRMDWVHRQLAGDPRPLFDANILYPTPLTFTLSDSMLLPSFIGSPLLAAGVAPIVAYNILLISGFFLSGLAVWLLVRRLTGSATAAFIGGLLYAFYPYRWEHYSHLELQMTQWMPLALLFLHRFVDTRRPREILFAALCAVAQLYSSMYYGVFFIFYAAVVVGVLYGVTRPDWRRVLQSAAIAGVIAIALAIPLARPYMAAQQMKGERDLAVVAYYSADLSDYFRPHPRLGLYAGRLLPDIHPERALFPGFTPIALTAVALVPPLGPIRLAYAGALAAGFELSHGANSMFYRFLYEWFPPIRGMRSAARISAITAISLVVLGAYGARRLWQRVRHPGARSAAFAILVVGILIDLQPRLDLMPVWPSPPTVYQTLAGRTDVVLAEFPFEFDRPLITPEVPFMYFSIWHGLQTVNGYSGFVPDDHRQLVEDVRGFPDDKAIAALRARGVTHVTVNCEFIPEPCATVLDRAANTPALHLIAEDDVARQARAAVRTDAIDRSAGAKAPAYGDQVFRRRPALQGRLSTDAGSLPPGTSCPRTTSRTHFSRGG